MPTSRKRVQLTLQHREPDRVPLDLGGSVVTGMHVDSVYKLRQALGLDPPGTPVKIVESFLQLGEIAPTWSMRSVWMWSHFLSRPLSSAFATRAGKVGPRSAAHQRWCPRASTLRPSPMGTY